MVHRPASGPVRAFHEHTQKRFQPYIKLMGSVDIAPQKTPLAAFKQRGICSRSPSDLGLRSENFFR